MKKIASSCNKCKKKWKGKGIWKKGTKLFRTIWNGEIFGSVIKVFLKKEKKFTDRGLVFNSRRTIHFNVQIIIAANCKYLHLKQIQYFTYNRSNPGSSQWEILRLGYIFVSLRLMSYRELLWQLICYLYQYCFFC